MDEFTLAYIEAALWSSCDDDETPLDSNYDSSDIAPELLVKMQADCEAFQSKHGESIDSAPRLHDQYSNREMAGHDFWLTRNHHGSGFWDMDWPKELGELMTKSAHAFGECNLYVGDDDKIYA